MTKCQELMVTMCRVGVKTNELYRQSISGGIEQIQEYLTLLFEGCRLRKPMLNLCLLWIDIQCFVV
jgi:hypothetical protein